MVRRKNSPSIKATLRKAAQAHAASSSSSGGGGSGGVGDASSSSRSVAEILALHRADRMKKLLVDDAEMVADELGEMVLVGGIPSYCVAHSQFLRGNAQRARPQPLVAGPPPPPTWTQKATLKSSKPYHHTFALHPANLARPPHCLLDLVCQHIATRLHAFPPHHIAALPFHYKESILAWRAILTSKQDTRPLVRADLKPFLDSNLRFLDLSHSKVNLKTLGLFLPRGRTGTAGKILRDFAAAEESLAVGMGSESVMLPLPEPDPVPDSWEDADRSDSDTEGGDFYRRGDDPSLTPLHSLSLAFTDLPATPLARLLVATVPTTLSHLNLSGCFTTATGPGVLDILAKGLLHLVRLDLSHCVWASEAAILALPWSSGVCFPFLAQMVLRECPVVELDLVVKFREIRPYLAFYC
ncbi:hypothetical protein HDU96_000822 [Phlyctochytrium bullatum]|nr:hypothetical protein HDU96_000822 [Phlyctochytrium bullatum]